MDEEHGKGLLDKAKGAVKEAVGKVTGNEKLEAEGKAEQAKADVKKAGDDVKDAFDK